MIEKKKRCSQHKAEVVNSVLKFTTNYGTAKNKFKFSFSIKQLGYNNVNQIQLVILVLMPKGHDVS